MESWSVSHKNLQIFCAGIWDTPEDCTVILNEVGVASIRIRMNEPSIARWYSILIELMRMNDGSMSRLVTVLISKYPKNDALRTVCAPWILASPEQGTPVTAGVPPLENTQPEEAMLPETPVPKGAVLVKKFENNPEPKPKTKPEPVPVVAPPDFADDASLVVPRIDTLWEAMVDTNKRLIALERWKAALFAAQAAASKDE